MTKNKETGSPIIDRRDFLNGVGLTIGAGIMGAPARAAANLLDDPKAPKPPPLTGMRGSHPGSFDIAHAAAAGAEWDLPASSEDYDLIIVGAGISGLSAAYIYRRDINPDARILILDNHDDFGGHAKRNEFTHDGKTHIGFGGTMLIEAASGYPAVSRQLIQELGINDVSDKAFNHDQDLKDLGIILDRVLFLDKETFGTDKLITGDLSDPASYHDVDISAAMKTELVGLFKDTTNYISDKTAEQRDQILKGYSWARYLKEFGGFDDDVLAVIQKLPHGVWAIGADALPAWMAMDLGYPGFGRRAGAKTEEASYTPPGEYLRFPDGNATIARLLVSKLVPNSTPARSVADIITATFDYSALDKPRNPVRIRLNSTAISLKHRGENLTGPVDVTFIEQGVPKTATAKKVVWAGYHAMLRHICPDVPEDQWSAMAQSVRAPLVYTSVFIRNWKSFVNLGINGANCPGSFFQYVRLTHPVSYGDYTFPTDPDEPMILHLQHIPLKPGLPPAEQFREGRRWLLKTPFSTFEKAAYQQLNSLLGPGGFDADKDILGITVNRWSHGYAYSHDPETDQVAWYPSQWQGDRPWEAARKSIGNIVIAGTDAASNAMSEAAIEQADRAINELKTS